MILPICGIKNEQTYNKAKIEIQIQGTNRRLLEGERGKSRKEIGEKKLGSTQTSSWKISELEYEMNNCGIYVVNTYVI